MEHYGQSRERVVENDVQISLSGVTMTGPTHLLGQTIWEQKEAHLRCQGGKLLWHVEFESPVIHQQKTSSRWLEIIVLK